MNPQVRDLHIDRALTQISVDYQNGDFISDQILKRVPVDKESDKYYVFKGIFDVIDDRVRPGGVAKEIGWDFSTDTYFCDGHAIREPINDRQRGNADDPLDLDSQAAENVMQTILLNKEKATADLIFALATYDSTLRTTLSGTSQWSDFTNSDPQAAIEGAKQLVAAEIGLRPNTLILGEQVWAKLRQHTGLVTMWDSQRKRMLTIDALKELLEVENILVGRAMYNTANQGQAQAKGFVWGKHASLVYVPARPAQKTPALGYTFVWKSPRGLGQDGVITYKYREENRHSDIVENELYYDHKIVVQKAGYHWHDAIA